MEKYKPDDEGPIKKGSGSEYMIIENGQVVFDNEPARDQVMHIGFLGKG